MVAAKRSLHNKNVVEMRQSVYQAFIGSQKSGQRLCLHCQAPMRAIRQDDNNKVFFCKSLTMKQVNKLKKKNAITTT